MVTTHHDIHTLSPPFLSKASSPFHRERNESKDPEQDDDLARPSSQGHVSGYSLDCETGPSWTQILHFCLGNGQVPGRVRAVLEGRGGRSILS